MRYGRTGQGQATEKAAEGGSLCQGKQVWVWPCTWPPRCNTLRGETGFGRCCGNPQTVVGQVSLCSLGIPISAFNIAFVENHAQSTKPPPTRGTHATPLPIFLASSGFHSGNHSSAGVCNPVGSLYKAGWWATAPRFWFSKSGLEPRKLHFTQTSPDSEQHQALNIGDHCCFAASVPSSLGRRKDAHSHGNNSSDS